MHTPNLKVWTDRLREPDLNQTTGALVDTYGTPDGIIERYCCLGVGCVVAGISQARVGGNEVFVSEGRPFNSVPPIEFHRWLGLNVQTTVDTGLDVYPDWPEDMVSQDGAWLFRDVSCANLNDEWHLTFSQIADVLDYFGIRL